MSVLVCSVLSEIAVHRTSPLFVIAHLYFVYDVHQLRMIFFFFFQAEDGIRDYKVTGVQTCALPISPAPHRCDRQGLHAPPRARWPARKRASSVLPDRATARNAPPDPAPAGSLAEIGRASCRERV